jgi:cytochrome P450
MRNPEKLRKAHAEIDVALAAGVLSSPIKYSETTTKLPYICACIKEAMRMHPSVALSIPRYAPEDGIRMADKFIPKGYRVGLNPAVIHYNKEVFGPDADQFRPERWLVSEEKWKIMEKGLLVFGAGTRVCIGKNVSTSRILLLPPLTNTCRSPLPNYTRLSLKYSAISIWKWHMTSHGERTIGGSTSRLGY